MQTFTTITAALAIIAGVSASPLKSRQTHDAPQNSAPSDNHTPLATPQVNSLADCLAQCQGNPSCVQYTFVNNVCKIFGPATQKRQTHDAPSNAAPSDNRSPLATPAVSSPDACLSACKGNPSCVQYTFVNNVCKIFGPANTKRQTHDAPIQSAPSDNRSPISTPAAASADTCLAQCKGNPSCIQYTFINNVCKLFGTATARREASSQTHDAPQNMVPAGNPTPIATPAVSSLELCLASCKGNGLCVAYTFVSGVCKLFN